MIEGLPKGARGTMDQMRSVFVLGAGSLLGLGACSFSTVWFENRIFAAPGRWDADSAAPWDKVAINLSSTAWMPTWPDVPNPENRDCMCLSSTTTLAVGVPNVPSTVTLNPVDVRRVQSVIQAPSAANDWELIVTVSDYMVSGAHPGFVLEIDVKPN